MYVCHAGHMAIRKSRQDKKGVARNQVTTYYFDIEKCKHCTFKDGCYKDGSKSKTYSVSIKSNEHKEKAQFQDSVYFKDKSKERYKIVAKNSELKHRHGFDVASSSGLLGMQMQGAMAIFAVNLKRILKVMGYNIVIIDTLSNLKKLNSKIEFKAVFFRKQFKNHRIFSGLLRLFDRVFYFLLFFFNLIFKLSSF